MTAIPLLEARDIVAGYDERNVLCGVNLALAQGEFLGIIGPNGSGKSTLIRALTGVLPLRGGEVLFDTRPLREFSPRALAREIAVVPAVSAPAFAFSVREMVEMGRNPHIGRFSAPTAADISAVEEAMALTDIAHLQARTIDQLSSGELQRVIIARALAQCPRILLLDEPTAHLDIGHQQDIFRLLRRLNEEQQLTVLCISHDLNLAAEYCRRLALFSVGTVYCSGIASEVITADNLLSVYGTLVRVESNPYSGQPFILLSREMDESEEEENL